MTAGENQVHPNIFQDGNDPSVYWFGETTALWPGQQMSLKLADGSKILHHEKSLYQDVLAFKSSDYGNVLVLDGVIQCTERDEFSYQEMIAHLPLHAHPKLDGESIDVLVIGGGDGGVLREVIKHRQVRTVTLCEIDEAVPRVSKLYLPEMAKGFDHSKVKVHIGDGFEFLQEYKNAFDVIITDSSDPCGPAECLFEDGFFVLLKESLRDGGILCSQGECQWLHLDIIKSVLGKLRNLFPQVEYAQTCIPTYPCGQIGFFMAAKFSADVHDIKKVVDGKRCDGESSQSALTRKDCDNLKYYNYDIHQAAFILPSFTRNYLKN
ncbi:hypothetical protein MP228_003026 [Amoeboaphelidium protococcarum]|nr:hypothetical protein MP228_003026 [Amoeboaphelidium protococcarum]